MVIDFISKEKTLYLVILLMLFSLAGFIYPDIARSEQGGVPEHIMLSWTADPLTTQTIAWNSVTAVGQDKLQYLPAASFDGSFNDAFEATALKTELYDGYFHYESTLSGLSPAAKYIYRVGGEGAWSEHASFSTANSGNKFSFVYMGDVQEGFENWGEMVQHAYDNNPGLRFALLGGDLVSSGYSSDEWQQFFTAASPVFRKIPLLPATGNHDDRPLFWGSFALPQNGPEGFTEKFYSFDYGNCHIAVLDSNLMGASAWYYDTLKSWLQNDLASSNQQWKFIVFHYPPYPVVEDGHAENIKENWVPLFEQTGVDLVFVGHQHVYMRSKPLRDNQVQADGEGIVYIMGNAGSKFYPAGESLDYIAKELDYVSSYQLINIDGDKLSMIARNADGQVIDSYMLGDEPDDDAQYFIAPVSDENYQTASSADGVATMTVKTGIAGMKYFKVKLTALRPHTGLETVVFTHLRNGIQLGLNAAQADFDLVNAAQAGFKVEPGDIIKAYVLDDLSNSQGFNPIVLQL